MSFTSRTPVNQNPDQVTYRRGFVTRHQVSGWRFLMRRIASGVALHDTRMLTDPLRTQSRSVAVGVLIVVTGLIGCFVISLLRPGGSVGNNTVLADRNTSALYVRVDDRLHSVLNLTSARLIAGNAVTPTFVGSAALDELARGPMVGIPGAPERMVQNESGDADWVVCDDLEATRAGVTVIGGPLVETGVRATALPADKAVLVTAGTSDAPTTWLLWDGRRSRIDLADHAAMDALGLGAIDPVPRPIPPGLFNAIPEGAPLLAPVIPDAGSSPQFTMSVPVPVGAVVAAFGADGMLSYFAVLPDGLQPVSPVLAALLRNTNSYGLQQPPRLRADEVSQLPASRMLDTAAFPERRISLVDPVGAPVVCARWSKAADASSSSLTLLSGAALPIARGAKAVELPGRSGAYASRVVLPVGTGYFVQTVGQEPASPPAGSLFWLSDTGMRYGIEGVNKDELTQTVAALGLRSPATPVPWSVLTLFGAGPALSKRDALTVYSGTENR
ncbi:type VII secretion protein EccB [Mycobacterium sp. CVI_P3]|uniref:Type VII secretion protein EccB n=1 Tax=Mycobacterium pinniadriaticum TaxID=2994102 RepID=A0ABT3SK06_9MYCO|nr:type VII secretion protein EccB [Mycobacterium pinniadriaticum]MCX2933423.1 type VII secretion protein EccB [Mycobacterium pinniadriaticum]MCX2939845.1 type VII secretion protein EccB [Mycobacterium pinniadriaticum]